MLASGLFQHFWLLERVGSQEDGSWEAPAMPGQGAGGFAMCRITPGPAPGCPVGAHPTHGHPSSPRGTSPVPGVHPHPALPISSPWM